MSDVDTRISPALHPRNVQELDGYDDDTKAVLGPTETAFSVAYEGLRSIYDAKAAAATHPGWTAERQVLEVDGFAQKQFDRIAKAFDTTRGNLVKGIASLEAELSRPVESTAATAVAAEVRAFVKNLPTGKLHGFLNQAIAAGDETTMGSVLGAPPYLSGLTPEFQQTYIRRWREKANPEAAKRLRAMQGAEALIRERSGLVFKSINEAVGATPDKAKALRAAKTQAEKAFVMGEA